MDDHQERLEQLRQEQFERDKKRAEQINARIYAEKMRRHVEDHNALMAQNKGAI